MDQDLTLRITGDASSAIAATTDSQASLDRLTAAVGKLVEGLGGIEGSAGAASTEVSKVGAAAAETDVSVGSLTTHARSLSGALVELNTAAGAAAGEVAGVGEAFNGLAAANPVLLGIVAALAAVAGGLAFLKSGAEDAMQLQDHMAELKIAVENAGASFAGRADDVKHWADALAEVSGVTADETIPMVQKLVDTGQNLDGAMGEVQVAVQAAAIGMGNVRGAAQGAGGEFQRMNQIVRALTEAQSGNYSMLEQLDSRLKPLVADHATLSQLVEKLADDTRGSTTANQSAEAQARRLHGELSVTSEVMGEQLLPMIGSVAKGFAELVDVFAHVVRAAGEMEQGGSQAFRGLAEGAVDYGMAIKDALTGNFAGAAKELDAGTKAGIGNLHGLGTVAQGLGKIFYDVFHADTIYTKDQTAAQKELNDELARALAMMNKGQPSQTKGSSKSSSAPFVFQPAEMPDVKQQTDDYQTLLKSLDSLPHSIAGYQSALSALTLALSQAHQQQDADRQALDAAQAAATLATQRYDAFGKEMASGVVPATKENLAILKGLNDERTRDLSALTQAQSGYQRVTGDVNALTDAYDKNQTALAAAQNAWPNFLVKANAAMREELDTFKMTESQKVTYYSQIVSQLEGAEGDLEKYREQAEQKELNAYEAMLKQEFQAQQQFEQQAQSHMSSFLDDIVVEHKSMADELKNVYGEIEKDFIGMLAQMMAKALVALPLIQAVFGGGGGGMIPGVFGSSGTFYGSTENQASSASIAPAGGSVPNVGLSSTGGMIPSAVHARGHDGARLSPMFGGGSGFGLGGGSYGGAGVYDSGSGAASPSPAPTTQGGGGIFGLLGGAGGSIPWGTSIHDPFMSGTGPGTSASLGSVFAAGAGGALLGQLAFGGRGFADLGGAIGGIGGLFGGLALGAHFGPYGALAGALLGGLIGSLFGNHFSPADEPDIYQQDAWGQSNADMQGMTQANPMNANGKQYVMDSWTSQATNSKGWNVLMEQFVSQFKTNTKVLSPALQGAFAEIQNLWGGAQNQQYFNSDGKDGYLDIGSGERALWSKFWTYVQTYGPEISTLMANYTSSPVFNANINGSIASLGNYTPGGPPSLIGAQPNPTGGIPLPAAPPGSPGNPGNGGGGSVYGGGRNRGGDVNNSVTLHMAINGSMIANSQFEQQIEAAIARAMSRFNAADMQR